MEGNILNFFTLNRTTNCSFGKREELKKKKEKTKKRKYFGCLISGSFTWSKKKEGAGGGIIRFNSQNFADEGAGWWEIVSYLIFYSIQHVPLSFFFVILPSSGHVLSFRRRIRFTLPQSTDVSVSCQSIILPLLTYILVYLSASTPSVWHLYCQTSCQPACMPDYLSRLLSRVMRMCGTPSYLVRYLHDPSTDGMAGPEY